MSPFHELQQLDQEKKVVHKISSVSPVHQSWSEMSSRNELREMKPAAETEDSVIPGGAESKEDRQWKEMKLRLDDLPGILARLSKIKLTGIMVIFSHFSAFCLKQNSLGCYWYGLVLHVIISTLLMLSWINFNQVCARKIVLWKHLIVFPLILFRNNESQLVSGK